MCISLRLDGSSDLIIKYYRAFFMCKRPCNLSNMIKENKLAVNEHFNFCSLLQSFQFASCVSKLTISYTNYSWLTVNEKNRIQN